MGPPLTLPTTHALVEEPLHDGMLEIDALE